jgi:DNA-binding transcriptional ArsR family regulator
MMAAVTADVFAVIGDPSRRRILDQLREGDRSVGQLVDALSMSQPAVSKHLRVLREAGLASVTPVAQQRIYRLTGEPLRSADAWLAPYRAMWSGHLDALGRHLDSRAGR